MKRKHKGIENLGLIDTKTLAKEPETLQLSLCPEVCWWCNYLIAV